MHVYRFANSSPSIPKCDVWSEIGKCETRLIFWLTAGKSQYYSCTCTSLGACLFLFWAHSTCFTPSTPKFMSAFSSTRLGSHWIPKSRPRPDFWFHFRIFESSYLLYLYSWQACLLHPFRKVKTLVNLSQEVEREDHYILKGRLKNDQDSGFITGKSTCL